MQPLVVQPRIVLPQLTYFTSTSHVTLLASGLIKIVVLILRKVLKMFASLCRLSSFFDRTYVFLDHLACVLVCLPVVAC